MQHIQTILITLIICTIIVNVIPNKFRKTIVALSTFTIVLDIIAFVLLAF